MEDDRDAVALGIAHLGSDFGTLVLGEPFTYN